MSSMRLEDRIALADTFRRAKTAIADRVTDEFLTRHPDWVERYGDRARRFGIEDACSHVDFLSGAIEGGAPEAFADYVRWARRVLEARGIAAPFLAENLEQVGASLDASLTPVERDLVRAFVAAGVAACTADAAVDIEPARGELTVTRELFLQAILAGHRRAATTIALEAIDRGCDATDLYVDVFQEALYEVGRLWERGTIPVAQEHMATAITQFVIATIGSRLDVAATPRGRAVIAGVEGELHQIGALMVADILEARGWDVRFLGSNMPCAGIIEAIAAHKADLVGISVTMPFNLTGALDLVRRIRDAFPEERPRVLLGGSAFRSVPALFEEAGADGYARDLRAALTLT